MSTPPSRSRLNQELSKFVEDYFVTSPVFPEDSELSEKITDKPLMGMPARYVYEPQGRMAAVQVGSIIQEWIERLIRCYESR